MDSLRLPTRYHTQKLAMGTRWISLAITVRPLESTVRVTTVLLTFIAPVELAMETAKTLSCCF